LPPTEEDDALEEAEEPATQQTCIKAEVRAWYASSLYYKG
jgi:hypothetical protein